MIDIILASTSPRRHQLLALSDYNFVTYSVEVDETVLDGESPQAYITRMVQNKAQAAADALSASLSLKSRVDSESINKEKTSSELANKSPHLFKILITADTIGVLADDSTILVKPVDRQDAFKMWTQMSGVNHMVWTAVQLSVVNSLGEILLKENLLEKTEVTFIDLDKQTMESYWQTGESIDKAGGYAIQGKGAAWVERINGSYSNVVGLPLAQTISAIKGMILKVENW